MKKQYSEEQIIGFLREADAGLPVKELCRKHGFSDASFYTWRAKFGGMEVSDAKRLKDLESENAKLKKLLAEAMLDMEALKVVVKGKYWELSEFLCKRGHEIMPKGMFHDRRNDYQKA